MSWTQHLTMRPAQGTLTAGCVHPSTMHTPPQLQPGNSRDAKGRKVRGSWHGARGGVKAGVGDIPQQGPMLRLGGAADPWPGQFPHAQRMLGVFRTRRVATAPRPRSTALAQPHAWPWPLLTIKTELKVPAKPGTAPAGCHFLVAPTSCVPPASAGISRGQPCSGWGPFAVPSPRRPCPMRSLEAVCDRGTAAVQCVQLSPGGWCPLLGSRVGVAPRSPCGDMGSGMKVPTGVPPRPHGET